MTASEDLTRALLRQEKENRMMKTIDRVPDHLLSRNKIRALHRWLDADGGPRPTLLDLENARTERLKGNR